MTTFQDTVAGGLTPFRYEQLAGHPLTEVAGWTLVHFLWQGLLIAGLTAVLLAGLRHRSAAARYFVACCGMVAMAIVPLATAAWLTQGLDAARPAQIAGLNNRQAVDPAQRPAPFELLNLPSAIPFESGSTGTESAAAIPESIPSGESASAGPVWRESLRRIFPLFVAFWSVGVLLLSLRLLGGLWRVRQWRRRGVAVEEAGLKQMTARLAARMGLKHRFDLLESAQAAVPAVIGWLKPAVIVPASFVSGLTPDELESLLAHELAHIRRHDYLVNLLQTVIETLLFYHPAVWWLSGVVRSERENCCDDLAVAACGNRLVFARALARMEELRCGAPGLALSARGGSLLSRVQRLVLPANNRPATWWPAGLAALVSVVTVASGIWMAGMPNVRNAITTPEAGSAKVVAPAPSEPEDDDEFATHQPEVRVVDPVTGQSHSVLAGVKLAHGDQTTARLDMKYSNLMPYTFIPARIAKELGATDLGELDFGAAAPPKIEPQQFAIPLSSLVPPPPGGQPAAGSPEQKPAEEEPVFVDDLDGPAGERKIVPYAVDPIWVPDHLAFYGVNQTHQTKFRVVRIDRVDLGLGPRFGPVNALVLDDANTSLGVLGSNWARIPRGPKGESFVHAAVDGFWFMALESGAVENKPAANAEEKILATHTYDMSRRDSTGWIEVDGVGLPVDDGPEAHGVKVHVTLMMDILAVESATGKVLWHHDWGKQNPAWKTASIIELGPDVPAEERLVAEFVSANGETRRRFDLRTGKEIVASAPAAPDEPADDLVRIIRRDGDRVTLAEAESERAGRSPVELLQRHADVLTRHGMPAPGVWVTDQETLVSAEQPSMLPVAEGEKFAALDAQEVIFNLPEGSGMRAEFTGENIEITDAEDRTTVVVTNGRVKLFDSNGVERADASPDGGAELLVVDVRSVNGEGVLRLQTRRLKPDPDCPQRPVQVKCNLVTGEPAEEEQPPHGAVRFAFENSEAGEPARMKIRWHYDMQRLVEEAERESGQSWEQLLNSSAAPLQPAGEVPHQTFENPTAPGGHPDEIEWGPMAEASGLQSRLTLQTERPAVGQPLLLKLELRNSRLEPTEVDLQNYAPFRVLRAAVTQADGTKEWAPFIGMTPQTSGGPQALAPGEVITVWKNVDATTLFLLDQEACELFVEGGEWAAAAFTQDSNHLEVLFQPGRLPPNQALIASLSKLETRPAEWAVSSGFGAIYLSHSPTNLKRDVTTIQLWFTDKPLPADYKLGEGPGRQEVTTIAPCELGHLHVAALPGAKDLWPEYVRDIRIAAARALNFSAVPDNGSNEPAEDDESASQIRDLPWQAMGRVADRDGRPLAGMTVHAHCGAGSLFETGTAVTDAEGRYDLRFGPGIWSENRQLVQAATISVSMAGHFEQNLHRQGDLVAALEKPEGDDLGWGDKTADDLFLPGEPKTIDFVMVPATNLSGVVIGKDGDRLDGVRVSLTGPDLPPSSSVVAATRTDKGGRFELTDLPTGFAYQLLIEPAEAESPWLGWASPPLTLGIDEHGHNCFTTEHDGREQFWTIQQLFIQLEGDGINWKEALASAASEEVEIQFDGLTTSDQSQTSAGMATLMLGSRQE